jgi:hypothetical protein
MRCILTLRRVCWRAAAYLICRVARAVPNHAMGWRKVVRLAEFAWAGYLVAHGLHEHAPAFLTLVARS